MVVTAPFSTKPLESVNTNADREKLVRQRLWQAADECRPEIYYKLTC